MDFKDEFYRIIELIDKSDSFVFSRYGDGEVMLINGEDVSTNTQAYSIDKWSSKGKTKLGTKLDDSLYHTEDNWIYGIPCQCCNDRCKHVLLSKLKTDIKNITYANLWVNSNYELFKYWVSKLIDEVVVIGNYKGVNNKYPFNVKQYIPIPDDCVNYYEQNDKEFESKLIKDVEGVEKTLFLISAGPLTEVIIEILWKNNKNNKYIDVGSSLDEFIHSKVTRPYMVKGNQYSIKKCKF